MTIIVHSKYWDTLKRLFPEFNFRGSDDPFGFYARPYADVFADIINKLERGEPIPKGNLAFLWEMQRLIEENKLEIPKWKP